MLLRLGSPPGARYRYSNVGYSLLAAIVERASGMRYEAFLARHLFTPAGMTQTGKVDKYRWGSTTAAWSTTFSSLYASEDPSAGLALASSANCCTFTLAVTPATLPAARP